LGSSVPLPPKTAFTAATSHKSPTGVDVPCDCYTKSVSPSVGRVLDVYWTMCGQQGGAIGMCIGRWPGQQSPAIGLNSHRRVRGKTACVGFGKRATRTCAFTKSTSSALIKASLRALSMQRITSLPSARGLVRSYASVLMPPPMYSHRMTAPRFFACAEIYERKGQS
jgi:hypothetical protein